MPPWSAHKLGIRISSQESLHTCGRPTNMFCCLDVHVFVCCVCFYVFISCRVSLKGSGSSTSSLCAPAVRPETRDLISNQESLCTRANDVRYVVCCQAVCLSKGLFCSGDGCKLRAVTPEPKHESKPQTPEARVLGRALNMQNLAGN